MKNLLILVLVSSLFLAGCAGMVDAMNKSAGIGVLSVTKASFDNSTTIKVTPNWLYEGNSYNTVKLGAMWNSKQPDKVALTMLHNSNADNNQVYLNINAIAINVGGKIDKFSTKNLTKLNNSGYNNVSQTIYTNSENHVVIGLDRLREMLTANDVRLRIHTDEGYEDSTFSQDRVSGQTTARYSLKEFLAKIEATQKTI